MTFSVVVPTYRRPDMLVGCLRALAAQTLPPLEVLVCYRDGDSDTAAALASLTQAGPSAVREVLVGRDDNLAAGLRAGVAASRGELVALTDDDSEAPADWLEIIRPHFDDPAVAGVGGRDLLAQQPAPADTVGRMQWFGRMIGNHHAGVGAARDVDFLKGVNCCFRGDLLRSVGVDERLRGAGNVVHWELAMCLPIRRAGGRLIYDPSVTVVHHAAPRKDGDDNHRGGFNSAALRDMVHNETFLVLEDLRPLGRVAFALWSFWVGTGITPGVAQALRSVLVGRQSPLRVAQRWWATRAGRLVGLKTYLATPRHETQLTARRP